jgi:methyl-accepting chemotaxis protein
MKQSSLTLEHIADQPLFARMVTNIQGDDTQRSQLLKHLALAFAVVAAAGCALVLALAIFGVVRLAPVVQQQVITATLIVLLMVGAIVGATWAAIHLGRGRLATSIFLYGTLLYAAGMIVVTGGADGPGAFAFLFPIVAAGLFGRSADSVRLFVMALVLYATLATLQALGLIEPMFGDAGGAMRPLVFVLLFTAVGGLLAFVALLWSRSTERFIIQGRQQAEDLFQTNQKLMEKNFQQVELGSELSRAAGELLGSSHEQASGATEQASAVSQVSTTIEELGSTARQIALAAEQVAEAARQTLENLSEGQDAVDRSIQAMDRIRGRVQDVSARVLNLGARSQQIGEIIDLINDLSDETHLLALNAAIEAAGAGEHGRRFAVVAAEVKSLANRALAAAKEVKGVIAEIQQATSAAVLAAEEGGKEVERGVELAHSAGHVMDAIVMVAERTAQSSAEINLATAQQQSASEQVVETMREIADVARRTAAGARQIQDAAQQLTATANRLHGVTFE